MILTDLQAHHVAKVVGELAALETVIVTLRQADDEVVRTRVLDPSRISDYRDVAESIARNRVLHHRDRLPESSSSTSVRGR